MKTDNDHIKRVCGFTLIELLTVIFIIGLLAAILIPSVSVARRKARVGAAEQDLRNVATALSDYAIDNGTLPPRPGCVVRDIQPDNATFWMAYLARLGMIGKDVRGKFYDRFSESEDLNRNKRPYSDPREAMAEDQPTRVLDPITQAEMFGPPNGVIDSGAVPYQYFPVNSTNVSKFRQLLSARGDPNADRAYTVGELQNAGLMVPAPGYDRFALFSLGPQGSDQGIVPRNADNPDDLRLRTYYRLTRDLNGNQLFDFDYRARTKRLETDFLPDGSRGFGVIILSGP